MDVREVELLETCKMSILMCQRDITQNCFSFLHAVKIFTICMFLNSLLVFLSLI